MNAQIWFSTTTICLNRINQQVLIENLLPIYHLIIVILWQPRRVMLSIHLGPGKTRTMERTLRHAIENLRSCFCPATNKQRDLKYMNLLRLWGYLSILVSLCMCVYVCVCALTCIHTYICISIPNYCSKLKWKAKNSWSILMSKYTKQRILHYQVFYVMTSCENTLLIVIYTISELLKYSHINYILFFNFTREMKIPLISNWFSCYMIKIFF